MGTTSSAHVIDLDTERKRRMARKSKTDEIDDLVDDLDDLEDEDVEDEEVDDDEDLEDDEDVEDEEDEDMEDEDPDEAPKARKGRSRKAAAKKAPAKKVGIGTAEVAEAAGTTSRALRGFLRAKGYQPRDDREGRYSWRSLNDPEVKRIIKEVRAGEAKAINKERLANLKGKKSTKSTAKATSARKKSTAKSTTRKRRARTTK